MNKTLLIIGHVWPEPKSSAAGSRMLQLINLFQEDGYNIVFACANNKTDNAHDLSSIGIEEVNIQLNHSSFNAFITKLSPSVVLFDRFITEEQFGWRVNECCPEALRILDTEDLHGLRKGRAEAVKNSEPFSLSYLLNDTTKRELASIYRCDLSLIISEVEMQILLEDLKVDAALLHYIPFLLDPIHEEDIEKLPAFEERQDFVTIGNFLHEPNYDAVLQLKHHIWPLIRKALPKARLHIYGAYASQKVTQLHKKSEGFIVHGFAEDVNEVMKNARVCLVPIRFGAGLKGKVVDAALNGTPCVMSSIAAEGIFDGKCATHYIADSPEVFAQKAIEMYSSKSEFDKFQSAEIKHVIDKFLKKNFNNEFIDKLNALQANLSTHRLKNITGQVLQHQSLQSTKYLSKWIEEKNK